MTRKKGLTNMSFILRSRSFFTINTPIEEVTQILILVKKSLDILICLKILIVVRASRDQYIVKLNRTRMKNNFVRFDVVLRASTPLLHNNIIISTIVLISIFKKHYL